MRKMPPLDKNLKQIFVFTIKAKQLGVQVLDFVRIRYFLKFKNDFVGFGVSQFMSELIESLSFQYPDDL